MKNQTRYDLAKYNIFGVSKILQNFHSTSPVYVDAINLGQRESDDDMFELKLVMGAVITACAFCVIRVNEVFQNCLCSTQA